MIIKKIIIESVNKGSLRMGWKMLGENIFENTKYALFMDSDLKKTQAKVTIKKVANI
jgi:hypothetical protein